MSGEGRTQMNEKSATPGVTLFIVCARRGVLFEDIVHICLQTSFTVLKGAEEPGDRDQCRCRGPIES